MARFSLTLLRVLAGFVLASLTAGLVTVLFVTTPAEVLTQPASQLPATASETADLALLTATHVAIFSGAFVLIAAGLGEWFSIRSLPFYLIAGSAISLLGVFAQVSSEVAGQPTVLNNYAIKAFLTAGFFAGFVYWIISGQFAGTPPAAIEDGNEDTDLAEDTGEAAKPDDPDEEAVSTEASTTSVPEAGRRKQRSLLGRLSRAERDVATMRRGVAKARTRNQESGDENADSEADGGPQSDGRPVEDDGENPKKSVD